MFGRERPSSILCPSCGSLVGVKDARCLICGRARPGLFGLGPILRALGQDTGLVSIVLWGCGALYLACVVASRGSAEDEGVLALLSPSQASLALFGASGAIPVFGYGRWWTILSAGWLHGGILHIGLNMMSARTLLPLAVEFYGTSRTIIIYSVASAAGFLVSSLAGRYLPYLPFLHGGLFTVGASAALFGLIGALLYYGRRGGSRAMTEVATRWAVGGLAFGFMVPMVDNWAHLGGLAGGYLAARVLDPLLPERGDHLLVALLCLVLQAAAVVASVLVSFPS